MLHGLLVLVVYRATFVSEPIHQIQTDLPLWRHPFPQIRHVRQELGVVADARVSHLEAPVARPKCDCDLSLLTVLPDDFHPTHDCVERREALLAIDDESRRSQAGAFGTQGSSVFVV